MEFRPCIDIHNGKVKQIVGSTISDLWKENGRPKENFVADKDAAYYANLYRQDGLKGGHIINLNKKGTEEYEASKEEAIKALKAYPGGLQYGGGVDDTNALDFIQAGASHIIVTSYVFNDGRVDYDALKHLSELVGREHLVLDLSCTRVDDKFYIVTDRWQKITEEIITYNFLEGRQSGIDRDLVGLLAAYKRVPVTYAGGVSDYSDIELISYLSDNRMDFTVGSALDIFGGHLSYDRIVKRIGGH